jgi:hypothetical protein
MLLDPYSQESEVFFQICESSKIYDLLGIHRLGFSLNYVFVFCFGGTGAWTQGLRLSRQAFYQFSHSISLPDCS